MIHKLLREPLVHFIALGALVFLLFHFNANRDEAPDGKIIVTPGKIEQLVTGFTRTWHRPPTRQELDGLVEDHIREEVLYREALAMGLDKDDTIVRRRMRQKLEFLTEQASTAALPTDQELQSWLDKHPNKFRVEPAIAFSQVYFNASRRGETSRRCCPMSCRFHASTKSQACSAMNLHSKSRNWTPAAGRGRYSRVMDGISST